MCPCSVSSGSSLFHMVFLKHHNRFFGIDPHSYYPSYVCHSFICILINLQHKELWHHSLQNINTQCATYLAESSRVTAKFALVTVHNLNNKSNRWGWRMKIKIVVKSIQWSTSIFCGIVQGVVTQGIPLKTDWFRDKFYCALKFSAEKNLWYAHTHNNSDLYRTCFKCLKCWELVNSSESLLHLLIRVWYERFACKIVKPYLHLCMCDGDWNLQEAQHEMNRFHLWYFAR